MEEKEKNKSEEILASDITLRSESVQEILTSPPSWMLKWGTTIILCIILLVFFFAWIIKYPDVVVGQVKITTVNPPVQQVSYSSGKIISLNKKNNENVKKDETIAILENLLSENTGKALHRYVDVVQASLQKPGSTIPMADSLTVSGELEPDFNKLVSSVKVYNKMITDSTFKRNMTSLRAQIAQYNNMMELSSSQLNLSRKDMENALVKYKANVQLYENQAIAKFDFAAEESRYLAAQRQLIDLEKNRVQNLITLTDYQKQANDLQFQQEDRLFQTTYMLHEVLNNIKNQLQLWEQRYVIKAPFDGTLSYLNSWAVNTYVKQGESLFSVVPANQDYIAFALVPSANFGKIEIGQTVNMRMNNYAYNEFGELTGKVKDITAVPGSDNNYRIEISLDNGMVSSYKIKFEYNPEMTGAAQIITKDLSILDRIFYQFKELISR